MKLEAARLIGDSVTKINLHKLMKKRINELADKHYATFGQGAFKDGYTAALNDLQGKVDGLLKALEYYTLKSNYSIVDEGRNYSVDLNCYELDENTYQDVELGTTALQALAEFHAQADKETTIEQLVKAIENLNGKKARNKDGV